MYGDKWVTSRKVVDLCFFFVVGKECGRYRNSGIWTTACLDLCGQSGQRETIEPLMALSYLLLT